MASIGQWKELVWAGVHEAAKTAGACHQENRKPIKIYAVHTAFGQMINGTDSCADGRRSWVTGPGIAHAPDPMPTRALAGP